MEEEIARYFSNIFSSSQPSSCETLLDSLDMIVTEEMNELLLQEFMFEEVSIALG